MSPNNSSHPALSPPSGGVNSSQPTLATRLPPDTDLSAPYSPKLNFTLTEYIPGPIVTPRPYISDEEDPIEGGRDQDTNNELAIGVSTEDPMIACEEVPFVVSNEVEITTTAQSPTLRHNSTEMVASGPTIFAEMDELNQLADAIKFNRFYNIDGGLITLDNCTVADLGDLVSL